MKKKSFTEQFWNNDLTLIFIGVPGVTGLISLEGAVLDYASKGDYTLLWVLGLMFSGLILVGIVFLLTVFLRAMRCGLK